MDMHIHYDKMHSKQEFTVFYKERYGINIQELTTMGYPTRFSRVAKKCIQNRLQNNPFLSEEKTTKSTGGPFQENIIERILKKRKKDPNTD